MLKEIFDFIKGMFNYKFILDLPYLFLKPRTFFSNIENERTEFTIRRLAFYILAYDFLFLVFRIYLGYSEGDHLSFEYITLVVFDLFVYLFYFFPFLLLIKYTIPKISIKTIISFLILVHLNILILYFIFHTLFVSLENYLFAILRALTLYTAVPILTVGYAMIFSFTIKNRVKLILISMLILVLVNLLQFEISRSLNPNWQTDIYTLLRDPISEEALEVADGVHSNILKLEFDYPEFDHLLNLVSENGKNSIDSLGIKLSDLSQFRDSLVNLMLQTNYKTSKKLISRGLNALNKLGHVTILMDEFIDTLMWYRSNNLDFTKIDLSIKSNDIRFDSLKDLLHVYFDTTNSKFEKFYISKRDLVNLENLNKLIEENINKYDIWIKIKDKYLEIFDEYSAYKDLVIIFQDEYTSLLKMRYYLTSYYIVAPKPY